MKSYFVNYKSRNKKAYSYSKSNATNQKNLGYNQKGECVCM